MQADPYTPLASHLPQEGSDSQVGLGIQVSSPAVLFGNMLLRLFWVSHITEPAVATALYVYGGAFFATSQKDG